MLKSVGIMHHRHHGRSFSGYTLFHDTSYFSIFLIFPRKENHHGQHPNSFITVYNCQEKFSIFCLQNTLAAARHLINQIYKRKEVDSLCNRLLSTKIMVETKGLEPSTPTMPLWCSPRLSYVPIVSRVFSSKTFSN